MDIFEVGTGLSTTALLTFMSLYPFYIKKYHKHRYKGVVKGMAESLRTPQRAMGLPIGWFIGYLIYIML